MKTLRIPFTILCALAASALSSYAAQLATAKVLEVEGTVTKYSENGGNAPLEVGEILVEGDSISVTALSQAKIVFSNGSEITIEENTSINLAKLEQDSFGGGKSYEELQADPSPSQTLLELNYGVLNGHVKKIRSDSSFQITTPLGTAAIRGTKFQIKFYYNAERGEFLLIVKNFDGLVDIISRYIGELEYNNANVGNKRFDSGITAETSEPIPQTHIAIIRLHRRDPYFNDLMDLFKNYIPTNPPPGYIPLPIPEVTPEDPGTQVVSPENQGQQNGNMSMNY